MPTLKVAILVKTQRWNRLRKDNIELIFNYNNWEGCKLYFYKYKEKLNCQQKVKEVDTISNVKIVVRIFTKQKPNITVQNIIFAVIDVKKNFSIKNHLSRENALFAEVGLR